MEEIEILTQVRYNLVFEWYMVLTLGHIDLSKTNFLLVLFCHSVTLNFMETRLEIFGGEWQIILVFLNLKNGCKHVSLKVVYLSQHIFQVTICYTKESTFMNIETLTHSMPVLLQKSEDLCPVGFTDIY